MDQKDARKRRRHQQLLYLTGAALAVAFVGLVFAMLLLQQQVRTSADEVQRQMDLNARLRQLQNILINLGDAETSQRGYLLTGDPDYLAPYRAAIVRLPPLMQGLDGLQSVDPSLAANAANVKEVVARKMEELAETIRLNQVGRQTEAVVLVQTGVGNMAMARAREEINDISSAVRASRDAAGQQIARAGQRRQSLAIAAVGALALCFVLAATQIGLLLGARTRFEKQLQDSEARHRLIVEDQSELISLARPDGTLTYVNPAYARQFGTTAEELTGGNLFDHIDPAHRAQVRTLIDQVLSTGTPTYGENRMRLPGGNEGWVAWTNSMQAGADGQPQLHSVGRDITAQKQAEAALRESEEFLARTGRLAGVGGWEVDLVARQVRWSEQVRQLHEVAEDFVPDLESGIEFFEPEARPTVTAAVEAAQRDGTPFDLELPLVTARGRRRFVRVVGDAQRGPDGQPMRLVGAMQDITELKRTEGRLRELTEIVDNTPDYVVQTDWTGRVHYINRAAQRALGFAPGAPVETHFFHEFNTAETNARYAKEITPAIKRDGVWLGETTVLAEGARVVPVTHLVIGHRDAQGRVARYSAVMRDISSEVRARAELQLQTSTLHAIIEAIPAMVAVFDKGFRYRLVNREFERQRALQRDAVIGRSVAELFGQEEYNARWPWVQRVLAGETVTHERASLHAGQMRNVSVTYIPLRLADGSVDGFITVAQDITSHRAEERRLIDLSERDALTGLLNRAGFTHYLEQRLVPGEGQTIALLYIDLDRFKPVNDTYGHAAGDAVLQQVAQRLKNLVRPSDGVARLGGDEFAIVLPGVRDQSAADAIAHKVVVAAGQPFALDGATVHIGASVGVALGDGNRDSVKQLLARADEKVYAAKAAGRGRAA